MKVHFDDQIFSSQVRGGISNYFVNLISEFDDPEFADVDITGDDVFTKNLHLLESGRGSRLPGAILNSTRALRATNYLARAANRPSGYSKPDILHSTFYFGAPGRRKDGVRRAVTIYDMIPERIPESFPYGNPHLGKDLYVKSADIVFCISETTKFDVQSFYPNLDVPIVVTPLGVSSLFMPAHEQLQKKDDPYFLFVGGREGYKNFDVVLRAMAELDRESRIRLLVAGAQPRPAELELVRALGVSDLITWSSPSDVELARCYQHAAGFIFSSRFEGFGLPTLEAMASGCPALLAATPCLEEVGGEAAAYFDPDSSTDLARLMSRSVQDDEWRQGLIDRGISRAREFSWRNTARLTLLGYELLLS
jgi:glycosyltransferase involved in cell wall biosynthesis